MSNPHWTSAENARDEWLTAKEGNGGQTMNAAYQTLIVKFSEPIKVLDGIFCDAERGDVDTLKGG